MNCTLRWFISALLSIALVIPSAAQQAPSSGAADVIVNMRDVDIADVAQQVSRITGRTIILDPSVKGTVNVTSATPLTSAGVWELFVSVLRGQGFAVLRNGRAWRIVPQATAVREPANGAASGRVSTRLIRLRNLSPDAAARIFRPLVAAAGSVEPVTNPNGIVVTDFADNVARIEALARTLDTGGTTTGFTTLTLRNGSAREVAAAIQSVLGEGEGGARAVADERSNIVLVRGNASALAEARRIAQLLDRPNGSAPVTRVFRLRFSDAESVTAILRGLMGGETAAANPIARTLGGVLSTQAAPGASQIRGVTSPSGGLATLTDNPAVR